MSRRICIGVHVHAEPERLRATLATLRATTRLPFDLLLLPDGPDALTQRFLDSLPGVPRAPSTDALGGAACFNRLARSSDADILVLLESGALVGPGWLDYMLAALDADPRHGLAGPSTNRSWNEQGAFARADGSPQAIGATAALALERFGATWQTLEPLYSLADFCYLVRRDVINAIGGADEAYGLGPCWEMDYNARAARAAFHGVWARSAYVFRAPFTERRRRAEAERFETSKRHFQDRMCAHQLRGGPKPAYQPHCRGAACEYFAPPDLILLHSPLEASPPVVAPPSITVMPRAPRITCIMPTRGRPEFVRQAITYFERQDYPNRELIVVDDDVGDVPVADPSVRFVRVPPGTHIGAKRNRACELATGSVIAHWDDDDWYGPRRLSAQVEPLLSGQADIVGLDTGVLFDLQNWRFWRCTPELHRRLFVCDVHGGTLLYRRQVWERLAHYPNVSLAEDAVLLREATRRGARLRKLANDGLFMYVRHGRNAWHFAPGEYLDRRGWLPAPEPSLPDADRAFYLGRAPRVPDMANEAPLITCVMPTFNRRPFVAQSIGYFLRQDYPNRELLILDDGDDRIADLVPDDPRIRYVALAERMVLGAKRNLACDLARGAFIAHWDDDDWIAPQRLSRQVSVLQTTGAELCGAARQLYYQPSANRAWLYEYPVAHRRWVAGNTLCYRKSFWTRNRFPDIQVGEDTRFVWSPHARNTALMSDTDICVGLVHAHNTSPKSLTGPFWRPHPLVDVQRLLGEDFAFYAV